MKAERTQKKQFILAVSGVKNSGKTTLITKILPLLKAKGLNVQLLNMMDMILKQMFRKQTAGSLQRQVQIALLYFQRRNI